MLSVIILTKNEQGHIARAIESVRSIAQRIYVVDSGSNDDTIAIAKSYDAIILSNPWRNYATQFNWAIAQLPDDSDWVLRLDADEYVTDELNAEIHQKLNQLPVETKGIIIGRRMTFLRRTIRYGGIFPTQVIRFFRYGYGQCENRWMDEHLLIDGEVEQFSGEIIDDNMNTLTWWTEKHNQYANREAIDMLNQKHHFMGQSNDLEQTKAGQAGRKRWIKNNIYTKIPMGLRPLIYFLYRYIIRLGFLDGKEGFAFHFLQGFWYRYLVDVKIFEVEQHMKKTALPIETAILDILGITVNTQPSAE